MDIVKHMSPRAEQIVSEHNLGQIRVEYSENLLARGLVFTLFLPIGLVLLAVALPTLLAPAFTNGEWWQRMGNLSYFLMGGTCFSLFGLIGMTMVVVTLWKGEKRLYLAEKGFVVVRRQIETIIRWDSVAEIHKHIVFTKGKSENVQQVRSSCSYTIIPTEGKRASFLAEPGPTIEETVTTYQFPSTLERYTSGKTLSFGWLTLDSKGLHLTPTEVPTSDLTILAKLPGVTRTSQELQGTCVASGEFFLPWEQLACSWIDESRSTLILSRQGERKHWAIVPLYQIANPALCLALIDHICFADTPEIERRSEGERRTASQPELLEMAAPDE
ncbi:MAG TPA: DUF6585 family protein [Ktedonosporobacter sp.]|jgi:hypothetical protein|nr:DUF6585 family protein [Ktedonosporobacter sp.]